jgi:hypothetical protein
MRDVSEVSRFRSVWALACGFTDDELLELLQAATRIANAADAPRAAKPAPRRALPPGWRAVDGGQR